MSFGSLSKFSTLAFKLIDCYFAQCAYTQIYQFYFKVHIWVQNDILPWTHMLPGFTSKVMFHQHPCLCCQHIWRISNNLMRLSSPQVVEDNLSYCPLALPIQGGVGFSNTCPTGDKCSKDRAAPYLCNMRSFSLMNGMKRPFKRRVSIHQMVCSISRFC